MTNEIQVAEQAPPMTIAEMKQHLNLIIQAMADVMKEGVDFGKVPGTGDKPTLLKPGAEKLNLLFRLAPEYEITETYEPTGDGQKHYTVVTKCTLYHIPSGRKMGTGFGSCSTKEKKYAYRKANRKCPTCGKESIFKSKKDGEGWYCWAKMNGCGATFKSGDEAIEGQESGQVQNPDMADQYNTVLKMSNKRALVACDLNVTGASALFTQDVEDMAEYHTDDKPKKGPDEAKPTNKPQATTKPSTPVQPKAEDATVTFDLPKIKLEMDKADSIKGLNDIIKTIPDKNRSAELMEYYGVRVNEIKGKVNANA